MSWASSWWTCWWNGVGKPDCAGVALGFEASVYIPRNPYLSLLVMRNNSASLPWLLKSDFSPRWWLIQGWKLHHAHLLFFQCPLHIFFKPLIFLFNIINFICIWTYDWTFRLAYSFPSIFHWRNIELTNKNRTLLGHREDGEFENEHSAKGSLL